MQKNENTKTYKKCSKKNKAKNKIVDKINSEYIEENKFVLFNVIRKNMFEEVIEGKRTSIGYMLPNNKIYDFISKNIYEEYKLYKKGNFEKTGEFALITNVIFKNSTIKYETNEENLKILENMLEKYIREYNSGKAQLKDYWSQIEYKSNTSQSKKKNKKLKPNN